jgi:hypothetical protein
MRPLAALLFCAAAAGQSPPAAPPAGEQKPVLEYSGKPIALQTVCGDQEIADFGLSCAADEPCPVYLELSFVEMAGAKIVASGNLHTANATLWSVLLISQDSGRTWIEPHARIRGAALDQVQFVDFENGWAAGQIASSIPRDPFFLRTEDGGKRWRRLPVFDESFFGVIEQFWFESKTQGSLILERAKGGAGAGRYLRLETMTGGGSWMTRETSSKPFPGKRARGASSMNPDLRVRADAATRSFAIELRQGGKWTRLAAFALAAGECRPDPPKTEAEPPKPESKQ